MPAFLSIATDDRWSVHLHGSDDPDVSGNDGRPKNNVFEGNTVSNTDVGTKIKEGDDNTFTGEFRTPRWLSSPLLNPV